MAVLQGSTHRAKSDLQVMLQTPRADDPMLEGTIDRLAGTMATSDEIGKNQPNAAFSPWLMLPRRERDTQRKGNLRSWNDAMFGDVRT